MMLTKEECDNALTRLLRPYFAKVDVQNVYHGINRGHSIDEDSNLLTLLIMEHFSNPPLAWEEIKEDIWVWDDIDKEYRKVYGKGIYSGDEYLMKKGCKVVFISEDEYFYLIYEPNRFYRKEVQE